MDTKPSDSLLKRRRHRFVNLVHTWLLAGGSLLLLAVTAYAGKGDEERIRDAGAEGYLAKPVSIGPFMAAVRGLVEKVA